MKTRISFAMLACMLLAADQSKKTNERNSEEIKALQGKWSLIAVTVDGRPATQNMIRQLDIFLIIKENRYTLQSRGTNTGSGVIQIDATKNPKVLVTTLKEGKNKGAVSKQIYKIEKDTLTTCSFLKKDSGIPEKFESARGSKAQLMVMKKVPK